MIYASYTPVWCGSLKFFFHYSPPEPMTFDYPGAPAEVEIVKIEVNGKVADEDLDEILMESIGDRIEEDILTKWANESERARGEARAEALYEQRLERRLA